jgi:hypothetical protein
VGDWAFVVLIAAIPVVLWARLEYEAWQRRRRQRSCRGTIDFTQTWRRP